MKRYIGAITTQSGYILALSAIRADNRKWLRWFTPGMSSTGDYPRVVSYSIKAQAQNHIRSAIRRGKKSGIFDGASKSKVIEIYSAQKGKR